MYQIVFSLGYYGIKKTPKTNKWQGMQLSLMNTTDVTFENPEQDWRVPDATDMSWHIKYEKRRPLRDVYIKVSSSYFIN